MIRRIIARRRARKATTRPLADMPIEGARTWFFPFTDCADWIGGGVGMVVDKRGGATRAISAIHELAAYERGFTDRAYDLFVDEVSDLSTAVECFLRLHLLHLPPPLPGDIPRVALFDTTWLEAHLGHAPCVFVNQDVRTSLDALDRIDETQCVRYRVEPTLKAEARRTCPACAALGRDPRNTAAGFDCPVCGYPSLAYPHDDPRSQLQDACPICAFEQPDWPVPTSDLEAMRERYLIEGPRRPPTAAEIAWRDRPRSRRVSRPPGT